MLYIISPEIIYLLNESLYLLMDLFVSMNSVFLDPTYKQDHSVFVLLCLAFHLV